MTRRAARGARSWWLTMIAALVGLAACAGTPSLSAHPPVASPLDRTAVAMSPAPPSPRASTSSPAATPASADPVARVALSGQAPAALAIDGDRMWVYEIESGDLSLVDLAAGRETRTIHFGGLGSHVLRGADGTLYVARFETGGSGDHLLMIDPASAAIDGVGTGPLGSLALAPDGSLLALEKADRLLRIDPRTRKVVDQVTVDINDEHMEVVVVAGSAWVSSDHTLVRRITLPKLAIEKTIDAGGGIPFVDRRGLIWGARPEALWAIDPATNAISRTVPL